VLEQVNIQSESATLHVLECMSSTAIIANSTCPSLPLEHISTGRSVRAQELLWPSSL